MQVVHKTARQLMLMNLYLDQRSVFHSIIACEIMQSTALSSSCNSFSEKRTVCVFVQHCAWMAHNRGTQVN